MKISFTIGELAKLHGVSRQALIHYHKIGLLVPRHVDPETGYRHYAVEQSEELVHILTLKRLGMGLSEIITYKKLPDTQDRIALLKGKEGHIEEELKAILRAQKQLTKIVSTLESHSRLIPFEMGFKTLPDAPVCLAPVKPPFGYFESELAIKELFDSVQSLDLDASPGLLFWVDDSTGEDRFIQVGLICHGVSQTTLNGGEYAYIIHKGPYETIHISRDNLEAHLQSMGFEREGHTIERSLLDAMAVSKETDLLVEVLMPFRRKG